MRLIYGTSGDVTGVKIAAWAERKIPHLSLQHLGAFASFGIVDEAGALRGAAIYHGYAPFYQGIEISFALEHPRFLKASLIAGILAYPMQQLEVFRVTAATPRKAASARRFLEKFGFKQEGLARAGFGSFGDAVIYGLTRQDWKSSPFNRAERLSEQESRPDAAACA